MLDHRREDQDRERQEQTDPEALLKFRNHVTVIVARMTRMSVMCLMATMSTMRIHVVLRMTIGARVVRTWVGSIAMLSGGHSYAPRPPVSSAMAIERGRSSGRRRLISLCDTTAWTMPDRVKPVMFWSGCKEWQAAQASKTC